jgi:hypothetical protein
MTEPPSNRAIAAPADILPPDARPTAVAAAALTLTPAGQAALAAAHQALAKKATAPATLRAYKADWTHFAAWCAAHGFVPVPAAPATFGAYLASLAVSHAPTTIRRRLSALGKMHRFNDLPWNPGDRPLIGGSCRLSKGRVDIGDPVKLIPKPGAERAIADCAADLEQQVSCNSVRHQGGQPGL